MATLPIHLEVEDTAVGPVLILLKRTPGIIKMNLVLDTGPTPISTRVANGGQTAEQITLALLLKSDEPVNVTVIQQELGGAKSRAYGALHSLKKKGAVKNVGKAMWTVTDKVRRDFGGQKLLPPPAKASSANSHTAKSNGHRKPSAKTSSGRAIKGKATSIMLQALITKPLRPMDIATAIEAGGASGKSHPGVINRARRDALIKKNTDGLYELTAKGTKEATAASADAMTGA